MFSEGKFCEQFRDNYIGHSHYDWDTSQIALKPEADTPGETLIHHWSVWGYLMRVETSICVKANAIGADTTFCRVIRLVEQAETNRAQVQRLLDGMLAGWLAATDTLRPEVQRLYTV